MLTVPQWPHFLGPPQAEGVTRSCPEDFIVEEIPRLHPEGEGGHLWLWVEKRSANTDWVAKELARTIDCVPRDVGFAGLKDRHAITRQWFSVPMSSTVQENLDNAEIEGVKILEGRQHTRKLKRGTLNGNRFQLKVRCFKGDEDQTIRRLEKIRTTGVPNYFGPQRFGYRGQNVEQGYRLLDRNARLPHSKRSIYLSALRSFLFNQVLAERVRREDWNTVIDGDLVMLDGTQSIFPCEKTDADIEERARRLDIHPTGPMPGEHGSQPTGLAAEVEQAVLGNWPLLTRVLKAQRVQAARRALRLCPVDLGWSFDGDGLELIFALPPGAYATTVLREILVFTEAEQNKK
ncbi:MAG: tRNA pseudouridine(13) synthase TruD [Xanthomonadales bacterium]|nr:tRNA pseudouridine(13) synthase TruD [Xanthomonadales bacterium]